MLPSLSSRQLENAETAIDEISGLGSQGLPEHNVSCHVWVLLQTTVTFREA